MITEDFVSIEIQELLNKKGFDFLSNSVQAIGKYDIKHNDDGTAELEKCCTYQTAVKWLREIHELIISIEFQTIYFTWKWRIYTKSSNIKHTDFKHYNKYEKAVEAAIKYCLENLI